MTSAHAYSAIPTTQHTLYARPFTVFAPEEQTVPVIFCSPHSGRQYPESFLKMTALGLNTLRYSEDAYVDHLFASVSELGAPFLVAHFPRVYVDPNREPFELDPAMFSDALPAFANTKSVRVAGGLGTIAKIVSDGRPIYNSKLRFADAQTRIQRLYLPYHRQLAELIRTTRERFGFAILVDCHSMPSSGGPYISYEDTVSRADIILGDRFGTSCATVISRAMDRCFSAANYRVTRNNPYAGGYVTNHYGRPSKCVHALQIEVNRKLYMDEHTHEPVANMEALKRNIFTICRDFMREIPSIAAMVNTPPLQDAAE